MPVRNLDSGFERIERARMHVASLQAHHHRGSWIEEIESATEACLLAHFAKRH